MMTQSIQLAAGVRRCFSEIVVKLRWHFRLEKGNRLQLRGPNFRTLVTTTLRSNIYPDKRPTDSRDARVPQRKPHMKVPIFGLPDVLAIATHGRYELTTIRPRRGQNGMVDDESNMVRALCKALG